MTERGEYRPHEEETRRSYEGELDGERYRVLSGLVELRGQRRTGEFIVNEITSGAVKRVVIFGEPGVGKTSLLSEVISASSEVFRREGRDLHPRVHLYDEYLARTKPHLRDTPIFNKRMVSSIQREKERSDDIVQFVEIPGVGHSMEKDRGVTALRHLIRDTKERGEDDTLFAYLIPNEAVQRRSGLLRQYILEQSDENVIEELKKRNVIVRGTSGGTQGGAEVKSYFKRMAMSSHIDTIGREETRASSTWRMRMSHEEYARRESGVNELPFPNPEEIYRMFVNVGIDESEQILAYAQKNARTYADNSITTALLKEKELREEHELPEDRGLLVFNPYSEKETILDFSSFKRAA